MNVLGYLSILCSNVSEAASDKDVLDGCREVPWETKHPVERMRKNGDTPTSEHSYLAIVRTTIGREPSPSNNEMISVLVVESASFANSSALARFWSAMLSIRLC